MFSNLNICYWMINISSFKSLRVIAVHKPTMQNRLPQSISWTTTKVQNHFRQRKLTTTSWTWFCIDISIHFIRKKFCEIIYLCNAAADIPSVNLGIVIVKRTLWHCINTIIYWSLYFWFREVILLISEKVLIYGNLLMLKYIFIVKWYN